MQKKANFIAMFYQITLPIQLILMLFVSLKRM